MGKMLLALALLMGCAGTFKEATLSPQHPASPEASEAAWSDPSATLEDGAQDQNKTQTSGHASHGSTQQPADRETRDSEEPGRSTAGTVTSAAEAAMLYVCPMHPDVVRSQTGNCPKCGMKLVEKKANR